MIWTLRAQDLSLIFLLWSIPLLSPCLYLSMSVSLAKAIKTTVMCESSLHSLGGTGDRRIDSVSSWKVNQRVAARAYSLEVEIGEIRNGRPR